MARALLIIKPDAYLRGLENVIRDRIIHSGFAIIREERRNLSRAEVEELYCEHRRKPFFETNTSFLLSGEVSLCLIEGDGNLVARLRRLVGDKNPDRVKEGTIRGDLGIDRAHIERNLAHASSTPHDAEREIAIFFKGQH